MLYSVLQERIMTQPYGVNKEFFTHSLFLVLCNRLLTVTLALGLLLAFGQGLRPVAPPYSYALVSLSNVAATTCQYEALKYVAFPVQTLGKCAKILPVMAWGTLIMHKRYKATEYGLALAVTAGCTIFLMAGPTSSRHGHGAAGGPQGAGVLGLALMLGYLGADGFTSTFQDKLFRGYQMSAFNQMLYVNAFSSLISAAGLLTSGQLAPALDFVTRHPQALLSVLSLSLSATVGQLFIMHTIRTYGALLFATVMNTRQFLSILLSCALFGHPLPLGQWAGTVIVFGALYYKSFAQKGAGRRGTPKRSLSGSLDAAADAEPGAPNFDAEAQERPADAIAALRAPDAAAASTAFMASPTRSAQRSPRHV
ncbi:hypothetical protein WJX81_005583 [Elliptochloris bilobata]|uniref:UDP-galactose transporter n=1 Tax=Elliptochloris bilobata TaxID=381761 RepID=A0AAW1S1K4_9CHLO